MSSILKKKENFITGAVHKWHPLPGTHHTEQKNKRYISVSGTGATLKMYEIELRVLGYIGMLKSLYRNHAQELIEHIKPRVSSPGSYKEVGSEMAITSITLSCTTGCVH